MTLRAIAVALSFAACNPLSCGPPANPERLEEGRARWIFRTAGTPTTPIVLADGGIVFGTSRGRVHRLAPDGSERWAADVAPRVGGLAASRDGRTIYLGVDHSCGGAIVAIDAAKGTKKWERPTPGRIAIPAVLPSGLVVVGGGAWIGSAGDSGAVFALGEDGREVWRTVVGKEVALAAPAVGADGTIGIPSADGTIVALSAEGHEKWRAGDASLADAVSIAAVPGGFAVLSTNALAIVSEGRIVSRHAGGYRGRLGVTREGAIVVAGSDGSVAAFGPDGRERWRRRLERSHEVGDETRIDRTPIDVVAAPGGGAFVVTAKDDETRLVSLLRLDARGHVRWREKLVGIPLPLARPVAASGCVLVPAGHWNTGSAKRGGHEIGHQRVTCLRDGR